MSEEQKPVDATLVGIALAVGEIKTAQADLRRELLGNGQKGRIQDIEDLVKSHEEQFKSMNKKYWMVTGAMVATGHGIRALLAKLGII